MNYGFKKISPRLIFGSMFIIAVALAAAFLYSDKTVLLKQDRGDNAPVIDQAPIAKKEPLKILFGGDIFLDRSIRRQIEANDVNYPWANIESFLKSYKYKVANLEGPIWNRPQAAPTGSFSFAFQEAYIDKLKELGFSALSIANNHTLNQGVTGLANTRTYLEKLGIEYFGDPNNEAEFSFSTAEWEGNKLAFVGEHDLVPTNQSSILQKITELDSEGYFVIVYPHWGPEYVLTIPKIEQDRAHALIDAGADLIIGAHPHVVQPVEVYKGKVIFYSLGNFLFDQGFSYDTMHGLLAEAVFEEGGIKFILYPTEQNKTFQISLAPDEARQKMLDRMADNSIASEDIKAGIKSGEFFVSY